MFIITVGTTIFFKSIKAIATKFHPDCIAHEKQNQKYSYRAVHKGI